MNCCLYLINLFGVLFRLSRWIIAEQWNQMSFDMLGRFVISLLLHV